MDQVRKVPGHKSGSLLGQVRHRDVRREDSVAQKTPQHLSPLMFLRSLASMSMKCPANQSTIEHTSKLISCLKQDNIAVGTRSGWLVVPQMMTGWPDLFQACRAFVMHSRRLLTRTGSKWQIELFANYWSLNKRYLYHFPVLEWFERMLLGV